MHLEVDHIFILVEPEAEVADLLLAQGLLEGLGNKHPGQGTSNRRFYFANGMLEFLWVYDADEAFNGPSRELYLSDRAKDPKASPFGVILRRKDNFSLEMPFKGWKYQPDYFTPPKAFYVGANSSNLAEPLCIYAPFIVPKSSNIQSEENASKSITHISIYTPSQDSEGVLSAANQADRLAIKQGRVHLMEITLDENNESSSTQDFRPNIPLIIHFT